MQAHQEIVGDINAELDAELEDVMHDAGKAARSYLRGNSPKDTGAYSRSWGVSSSDRDGHHEVTVHNRKHYQLTHLLEDGHEAKNQYGGPYGFVDPATPEGHIAKADEAGKRVIAERLGVKV